MKHPIDVTSIATAMIAFGALATDVAFGTELTKAFGPSATRILAVLALLGPVGQTLRSIFLPVNPSGK